MDPSGYVLALAGLLWEFRLYCLFCWLLMVCSPVFIVSQIYSFMVGVLSAWLALSVCILVAGDLQSLPQTYPPRSSMFYLRNKMQTQRRVPCVVSNTDDAQRTVQNAWGRTEVLCADPRPAGYPLFHWKYFDAWRCMGKMQESEEGQEPGIFGQALSTSLPAQPWPLPSLAFARPVYLASAVGLGTQAGASGNLQPLFEFDPPGLWTQVSMGEWSGP